MSEPRRRLRAAIYTRKSSDEGLEQDFNSLDAQREACAAYITSQKHEGWAGVTTVYDDGGYSGGTMDRPALTALLADIKARRIDVVVVYKVDRLTRALVDFAKIVEVFDAHDVSFVSVTQAFNTTTSMGRLTLNVLLSFAQFEREVTGERIRDKIAASKKKGLWMGGFVPLGYRPAERTLAIEETEAAIVRQIFAGYLALGTVSKLEAELARRCSMTPARVTKAGRDYGGKPFSRGHLYKLLSNPIYCGEISHRGVRYPGQHPAIIAPDLFAAVAERLATNGRERKTGQNSKEPSLLAGLLVDSAGDRLIATHASKQGTRYRYYVSKAVHDGRRRGRLGRDHLQALDTKGQAIWRLPAGEVEALVVQEMADVLTNPVRLFDLARRLHPNRSWSMPERDVIVRRAAAIAKVCDGTDVVALRTALLKLVTKIKVASDTIAIALKPEGLMCALGVPIDPGAPLHGDAPVDAPMDAIWLTISVRLRRRGVETKLVMTQDGKPQSEPDQTLIRALARARRWMHELVSGVHGSVVDLAAAYGTNDRYVARHLPLACLAPTIVMAILEGRQPVELTGSDLLTQIEIPRDWSDQARVLGMS